MTVGQLSLNKSCCLLVVLYSSKFVLRGIKHCYCLFLFSSAPSQLLHLRHPFIMLLNVLLEEHICVLNAA